MAKKNRSKQHGSIQAKAHRHVEHRKKSRAQKYAANGTTVKPVTKTGTLGKKPERHQGSWNMH